MDFSGPSSSESLIAAKPAASGPEIGLENMDGTSFTDRLTFSRIQNPVNTSAGKPDNKFHDTAVLRLRNTGTSALVYSGTDVNTLSSYAYLKSMTVSRIAVKPSTKLSYWIRPQSTATRPEVKTRNSTCVSIDLIFSLSGYRTSDHVVPVLARPGGGTSLTFEGRNFLRFLILRSMNSRIHANLEDYWKVSSVGTAADKVRQHLNNKSTPSKNIAKRNTI